MERWNGMDGWMNGKLMEVTMNGWIDGMVGWIDE
jgi:hypothetical protein